jgi:hypothetical protein
MTDRQHPDFGAWSIRTETVLPLKAEGRRAL